MTEQWRTVPDWPEYEVSDQGRVRGPRRLLKPQKTKVGYERVILSRKPVKVPRSVHRLVAEAFIGPIATGLVVNHLNGVKTDNRVENLEIVSHSENHRHAIASGLRMAPAIRYKMLNGHNRRGSDHPNCKLNEEQVREIKRALKENPRYGAGRKLAQKFGVTEYTISAIKRGAIWAHI